MKKGIRSSLLIFIIAAFSIGTYFTNSLMFMKRKKDSFIKEREIKANRLIVKDFEALPKTSVSVQSPFGYSLDCLFVHPNKTNKWMIFCHGITENKYNSIKYMNIFIKRGFNAVIYDHRRHGLSGGKTSSYGYYEKLDLKTVIDELKKREGEDVLFGIHGESMGAVTALLYGGSIRDDAAFYIADCPFSTFRDQLRYRIKKDVHLPAWTIMPIGDLFLKIREGYRIKDVSPLSVINYITQPILFIHSEEDPYIPVSMTKQLFEAKNGPKQLYIAKKGVHAQSFNENQQEYEEAIDTFLNAYT